MKSRSGFVSNSSSSSFIVGFDEKPRSAAFLRKLLFGDMEFIQYYDNSYSTAEIAQTIFNDLKGARPVNLAKIIKTVRSGHFPGYPDIWNNDRESTKLERQFSETFPEYKGNYWDVSKITKLMAKQLAEKILTARQKEIEADNKAVDEAAEKYVKERVKPQIGGKKMYVLEYADDDGKGQGHIEHAGVFENIPHVQISHH